MSESSGGTPAPAVTPAPAPANDAGATPTPAPLGQSPRLQGGITLEQGIRQQIERAKGGDERKPPPRQAAPPPTNGATPPPAANDGAPPPASAGNDNDPVARMIEAMRAQRTPPPAAGDPAAPPQPGAEPAAHGAPVRVTIDGQTLELSQDQLISHIRKSNDYTQKTMQLADLTRQVNEKAAAIDRLLPIMQPEIERQIAALDAQLSQKPDWRKLAETDQAEYWRQDAAWKEALGERERLAALNTLQQQETAAQRARQIAEGHAALARELPGWEDPKTRSVLQDRMMQYGRAHGFSDAELGNIHAPHHVVALFKCMAFDALMGGVQSNAPLVPQVTRQGTPPPQRNGGAGAADVRALEQRFQQTASLRDGIALHQARRRAAH